MSVYDVRRPMIDRRVLYVGVSKLRTMDSAWLRNFSESDEVVVLQTGVQPVGVMVPYALFMAMQKTLVGSGTELTKAKRAQATRRSAAK